MTWKVKIAYVDGSFDLVEPDSLVSPDALPKLSSPLAPTWRFRFDDLDSGLWVDAYAFSTDKARKMDGRPAPAAPFEPAVSLQLLDSCGLEKARSVEVDGDVYLLRAGKSLLKLAPVLAAADELGVARDKQPAVEIAKQVLGELWARQDGAAVLALCKDAGIPDTLRGELLPSMPPGEPPSADGSETARAPRVEAPAPEDGEDG